MLLEKEYLRVSIDSMVFWMDMLEFRIGSVVVLAVVVVEVGIVVDVTTNQIIQFLEISYTRRSTNFHFVPFNY